MCQILHHIVGLDLLRGTPRWLATPTVLLCNRQRNPLVERPGEECHLSSIGAAFLFDS
jgi:hypothetical protein